MNTARITTTLVAGLLLAGCSAPADEPEAPATETTTQAPAETPTPTPTPETLSMEEAGAVYLELVAPGNAITDEMNAAIDAEDWAAVREAAGRQAVAQRELADALIATEWPAEIQPAVDTLFAEIATQVPVYQAIANSTTDEELVAAFDTFPASSGAAQQIRTLLGLDSVPVD